MVFFLKFETTYLIYTKFSTNLVVVYCILLLISPIMACVVCIYKEKLFLFVLILYLKAAFRKQNQKSRESEIKILLLL